MRRSKGGTWSAIIAAAAAAGAAVVAALRSTLRKTLCFGFPLASLFIALEPLHHTSQPFTRKLDVVLALHALP